VSVPAAPASDLKQGVLATNLNGKQFLSSNLNSLKKEIKNISIDLVL